MSGGIDDVGDFLKQVYPKGKWEPFWNVNAPYRAMLKKTDRKPTRGIVYMPAKLSGLWNIGITADNADLPPVADPTRKQFQLKPVTFTATIQVGEQADTILKGSDTQFHDQSLTQDYIEESAENLQKYVNIIYSGADRTRLGIVAADGANTITLSNVAGTSNHGALLLKVGMPIEVRDAHTSGSVRDSMSNQRVSAIDEDTLILTYAGPNRTLVAGDHVYVYGTYDKTPWTLNDSVDDGNICDTYMALARSTYPALKANIFGNGGTLRNIDEMELLKACVTPRRRCGKNITVLMGNDGQSRKIAEFIGRDRRFILEPSSAPSYSMGYNEGSFRIFAPGVNAKWVENPDIQGRRIYALAWDTFGLYVGREMDWWDKGGMLKPIPGTANNFQLGAQAHLVSIENQFCVMPIANSRIDDLKDPIFGDA
jgi:hypothetical protein